MDIEVVVKNGLCTQCGTCVAMCPKEAIELALDHKKGTYVPVVNRSKCNACGICYKVCPGHEVDFKRLNTEIFGKAPEEVLLGNYTNCYLGYANDHNIRYNSASGGLVTALLIHALQEGLIDGALVTRMKKDSPLEPEPFIARTREEIIAARGSKYCPVPANVALKEILESSGRFAVVGVPCHIHGVRKAEMINKKLKEKIVLHLGLFCSATPTFLATEFVFKKFGLEKENIKKLSYRGPGWPGGFNVKYKDTHAFIPFFDYYDYGFGQYFAPVRCKLCIDPTSEFADISFADAWLPEIMRSDKIGTSIVIPRNESGEKLLQEMASKKLISVGKIDGQKVILSQGGTRWGLAYRKSDLRARAFKNKYNPSYNTRLLDPTLHTYLSTALSRVGMSLASKRYLWELMVLYIIALGRAESLLGKLTR